VLVVVNVLVLSFVVVLVSNIANSPQDLVFALSTFFIVAVLWTSRLWASWSGRRFYFTGDGFWFFVSEKDDTGYEDKDGDKYEKEGPRFIGLDLAVEDEGVEEARCGVDAIKDGDDESRVVNFEASVETNDLEDGGDDKENDGENRSGMAELVTWILMRERA